jgi:ssRNA-specific RNase YbeY (16S rRNA maturation enzyme)
LGSCSDKRYLTKDECESQDLLDDHRNNDSIKWITDKNYVISFLDEWFSNINKGVLALTSYSYIDNKIIHADIIFNRDNFNFVDSPNPHSQDVDLESVLVHELGHFLGFKHVDESIDSIMNPKLQSGEEKRDLTQIDLEQIEDKYSELFN